MGSLVEWKPAGTAPKNGNVLTTPEGVIWRWVPYRKNSPQFLTGIDGRWQVMRYDGWANARDGVEPGEWRGFNMRKRTTP